MTAIRSRPPSKEYDENFDRIFRKDKMRVYLAGPMRGIPNFNFPAFKEAADKLREDGHEVFSPSERDEADFGSLNQPTGNEEEFAKAVHLTPRQLRRRVFFFDCEYICKHADAIALLPGWENSKGAKVEKALADVLDLEVIYL